MRAEVTGVAPRSHFRSEADKILMILVHRLPTKLLISHGWVLSFDPQAAARGPARCHLRRSELHVGEC